MDINFFNTEHETERSINCLCCHREIEGRHVIAVDTDHFCTRCGSQLVTVGIGKYTTDRRTA